MRSSQIQMDHSAGMRAATVVALNRLTFFGEVAEAPRLDTLPCRETPGRSRLD